MSTRGLLLVASLLALGGCTTSSNNAQPSSSGGSSSGGDAMPGTPPLTCLGIFQCVTNASCTTDACVDTCMQKGTSDSQKQVTDLATCNQNQGCMDATCLQSKCKTELNACIQGSNTAPTGTALSGNAPPGNVPSDFVGTWQAGNSGNLGDEKEFVFGADGSGQFIESYNGTFSQCASGLIEKYIGSAVIDESALTITINATKVEEITNTCSQPVTKDKPAATVTFAYKPAPDGDGIWVTDSECAAKYASDQASINAYCLWTYRKAK